MLTIDRINISVLIIVASVSVAQAAAGGEAGDNDNINANIRNICEYTLYFIPHGFFISMPASFRSFLFSFSI